MLHAYHRIEGEDYLLQCLVVGKFATNCYIISCKETKDAVVLDPGGRGKDVQEAVEKEGLNLRMILISHGHIDHVYGVKSLKEAYPEAVIGMNALDNTLVQSLGYQSRLFQYIPIAMPKVDKDLAGGDDIKVGKLQLRTVHAPGHSPGSLCYHFVDHDMLFCGDIIFKNSVGRTDLDGGDADILKASIRRIRKNFKSETLLYPGHGDFTNLADEEKYNPFFQL